MYHAEKERKRYVREPRWAGIRGGMARVSDTGEPRETPGTTTESEYPVGRRSSRRGRRLDRSLDLVISKATLELLSECGYDHVTMDMVASRAGTAKTTLYRRWPSKATLVAAALSSANWDRPCPDTGSLRRDLDELLAATHSPAVDEFMANVTAGLMTAIRHDTELAAAFRKQFVLPRQQLLRQVLERAATRGEIPAGRDLGLLAEVIPALMQSQAFNTCGPPGGDYLRRIIAEVVYPLAIAPIPESPSEV
jgi:AcrR family transcriptional regulator